MTQTSSLLFAENLSLAQSVTPLQSRKIAVYRWYNLNHSFSRDLVLSLIAEFGIKGEDCVLDPFCGSGTTILACRERGLKCVGLDLMPLSVFVSRGKVLKYHPNKMERDFQRIFPSTQYDLGLGLDEIYLEKFFPLEQLTELVHLRNTISQLPDPERSFFSLALLSILKEVSRTKNDGAFWRYKRDDALKTLREALPPQVKMMVADVAGDGKFSAPYQIARADARRIPLKNASVSAVITSPPYLNRHDYTRVYALELLFNFLKSNEELKKLRYKMLRSNVEAKSVVKFPDYHPTENLRKLLAELKECDLPNRKVVEMVEGYFEDMFGVLKELKRVCQPGSQIAFVVGNCKYGSVMFPVDELLAEIGDYVGLRPLKITIARYRGNAPQQMKKFGREASRESIVIWENKK